MSWSLEETQPYVPRPPAFYSYDNGCIHVLLMKWFLLKRKVWAPGAEDEIQLRHTELRLNLAGFIN